MNILLIQENGRHVVNREFRECFSLQRAFSKLGHTAYVWGLGHPNFASRPDLGMYDLIVDLENYDAKGWVPTLGLYTKPKKVVWSIDAHISGDTVFRRRADKHKADFLFFSTRRFVNDERDWWFPNAYDDMRIRRVPELRKQYNIGFCGSMAARKAHLDALGVFDIHLDLRVLGKAMVRAINSYRIHFNRNEKGDINYRNFETIGCGTLLLTNEDEQYADLGFVHGGNCLLYKSIPHMVSLVADVLADKSHLEFMSAAGLELAKQHTYAVRARQLLAKVFP